MKIEQLIALVEVSGKVLSIVAKARAALDETDKGALDVALNQMWEKANADYFVAADALAARAAEQ